MIQFCQDHFRHGHGPEEGRKQHHLIDLDQIVDGTGVADDLRDLVETGAAKITLVPLQILFVIILIDRAILQEPIQFAARGKA